MKRNMKGNRLRFCRNALRRVVVSFVLPFFGTTTNVERSSREKYIVDDEFGERWGDTSHRDDGKVIPVNGQTWSYLEYRKSDSSCQIQISSTLENTTHVGNVCKDYSIFRVAHCGVKVTPDDFSLLKRNIRKKFILAEPPKHLGKYCKDYAIFQVTV
ncbi:hypothetical protein ScPMuIL_004717 [Solemya velum]